MKVLLKLMVEKLSEMELRLYIHAIVKGIENWMKKHEIPHIEVC